MNTHFPNGKEEKVCSGKRQDHEQRQGDPIKMCRIITRANLKFSFCEILVQVYSLCILGPQGNFSSHTHEFKDLSAEDN